MLGIDKPLHMSSHDLVNKVRTIFQEKRVGHAGTLDPLASGVMIVGVGPATRLLQYVLAQTKRYTARINFGAQTSTDDIEGEVIRRAPLHEALSDEQYAKDILQSFEGRLMQMPPNFSAIHVEGKRAYDLARQGKKVELQAREVEVSEARLVGISSDEHGLFWLVDFNVSKGTYIRSLARDIGLKTGSAAHLGSLIREELGSVNLKDCISLEELALLDNPEDAALDLRQVLALERYDLSQEELAKVQVGALPRDASFEGMRAYCFEDKLYALAKLGNKQVKALAFFPQGVKGVSL
ncbi:MAG: tRNA pseudouridine(55) synthase TruB [Coriobacteriia bacterium]|nr:tRNA pseudouridine(55) synthase TruB [Coriobacteriia bacterium]